LAEVRAFEFLLNIGCSDIAHLHREQGRTVDFTASRQGTRYAVEVTRLNLPDSEKKKPIKMLEAYLSDGRKFDMISVNDNVEPFRYTLQTCVEREYRQLTEYIEGQNAEYSGLVIISAGIDYLVIRRVRTELHALRDEWRDILASVFDYLKESGRYSNLHGIFLIVAEKEDRIYSCPELGDI
jgi:hypothetical protein